MKKLAIAMGALLLMQQPSAAQPAPTASPVELVLIAPGMVSNAGLRDLSAEFAAKTGVKVTLRNGNMARIVEDTKTSTPAVDVTFLPIALMDDLEKSGGVKAGSRKALGRADIGLAVKKGAPVPDISTTPKLAAVLKSASGVAHSQAGGGSMQAQMIVDLLARPEFAGVKALPSTGGQGAQMVVRGEAPMALQLISEIVNQPELTNVGPLPQELKAYVDTAVAVTAQSPHPAEAQAFITYITRPEAAPVWRAKGLIRAN